jgi:3-carboxy-cis,cis-muconate cycloisomerase
MIMLSGGALKHSAYLAANLQVDAEAMGANIVKANDVILAEAAVFALARVMPRARAEESVKNACAVALAQDRSLVEVARDLFGDSIPAGAVDWQALASPKNYLGETASFIDAVLQQAKKLT